MWWWWCFGTHGQSSFLVHFGVLLAAVGTLAAAPVGQPQSTTNDHLPPNFRHNFQFIRNQLKQYGYLRTTAPSLHEFRIALKKFQDTLGVAVTGEVDEATIAGASKPRCAHSDLNDRGLGRRRRRFSLSKERHWDRSKFNAAGHLVLKWFISEYTKDISRDVIKTTVRKAFHLWSSQNNVDDDVQVIIRFIEASSEEEADINIKWATKNHGDEYPFDGPGDVLAHTFFPSNAKPLNGDIHFDDDEEWEADLKEGSKRFFPYVLVHEIGHALGLQHSKKVEAVMHPYYKNVPLDELTLDVDDKCGINWNYARSSNYCLFVWLMSEIVDVHGYYTQRRLGKSIRAHQKIPRCTDSIKKQIEKQIYHDVLSNQEGDVPKFTEQACNYLAGLHVYRSGSAYVEDEPLEKEFQGVMNEIRKW